MSDSPARAILVRPSIYYEFPENLVQVYSRFLRISLHSFTNSVTNAVLSVLDRQGELNTASPTEGGDLVDQAKLPCRLWLAGLAGLALLATGCTTAANELNPGQEALKVAARPPLGHVLADDSGHTVYMFAKDQAGESYCTGACASVWVPVTTKAMPAVEDGLNPRKVTLLKREGGLMQVAYNGHPLYYYQADTGSSDAYGQQKDQFGAEWYALTPAGNQAENSTQKGGNGYGS